MDKHLDWSLLQSLLALADHGSLSAAARATGQSQPTLGRHIRALEDQTGTQLVRRHARGLDLTPAALDLLEPARAMAEAAARLSLLAEARSATRPEGIVRVTASAYVSHFILPPMLASIRAAYPGIEIELVPSDSTENLLFGEADIAIRMYQPTQPDVITRHVGWSQFGLFASHAYIDRHGEPTNAEGLRDHAVVGYDTSDLMIRGMAEMGFHVTRRDFPIRCDDQAACWHLVRAGCGIGPGSLRVGLADPLVRRILPDLDIPPLPFWLTAHREVRKLPRIDVVWKHLAQALRDFGRGLGA